MIESGQFNSIEDGNSYTSDRIRSMQKQLQDIHKALFHTLYQDKREDAGKKVATMQAKILLRSVNRKNRG